MVTVTTSRIVLGGAMHGHRVRVLHGSTMRHAPSGDTYRRHGLHWWVPDSDTEEEARQRVKNFERK